jgi:hypothetical protein
MRQASLRSPRSTPGAVVSGPARVAAPGVIAGGSAEPASRSSAAVPASAAAGTAKAASSPGAAAGAATSFLVRVGDVGDLRRRVDQRRLAVAAAADQRAGAGDPIGAARPVRS